MYLQEFLTILSDTSGWVILPPNPMYPAGTIRCNNGCDCPIVKVAHHTLRQQYASCDWHFAAGMLGLSTPLAEDIVDAADGAEGCDLALRRTLLLHCHLTS